MRQKERVEKVLQLLDEHYGTDVFYTIVGTVAAYLVLSVIGGATTEGAGLFDTWYQVLLFVGDIVFGAGFVLFTALYIARKAGSKREEKESRS